MKHLHPSIFTLLCLLFLFADLNAQQAIWQQFPSQPGSGSRQDDIFFIDEDNGWTIEAQNTGTNRRGYIYKTTDGGSSWVTQDVRTGTHYRALGFTSATRGFAGNLGAGSWSNATDTNPLYETFDGGNTWSVVPNVPSAVKGICAIQILDNQTIIAAGRVRGPGAGQNPATNGGVYLMKSTDNGSSWTYIDLSSGNPTIPSGQGMGGIMDVHFFDQNNGFVIGMDENPYSTNPSAATYHGKMMKTTDGGNTWTSVLTVPYTATYFWKVVFPTPNIGYASLQNNNAPYPDIKFYKTINGGNSWTLQTINVGSFFVQGIGFADATKGWISGSSSSTTNMYEINYSSPTSFSFNTSNNSQAGRERLNKYRFITTTSGDTMGYTCGERIHVYKKAAAESGNTPCEAILAPINTSISGSITDQLTQSGGVPPPSNFSNTSSGPTQIWNTANGCEDRWFKVAVPASGTVRAAFTWLGQGTSDLCVASYSGACTNNSPSGFTLLGADDGPTLPEIAVSCQTPGDTVYFRVWAFGCGGSGTISTYSIEFTDAQNEPTGDESSTASALPVNLPTQPQSPFQFGDVTGDYFETKSNFVEPSCGTFNILNGCEDRWYKITLPTTDSVFIEVNRTDANLWMGMALYSTDCPNSINDEIDCDGQVFSPRINYVGTAGQTVYLRVWDYDCNHAMTFDIRAFTKSNVSNPSCSNPSNGDGDEPCNAPCLPVDGTTLTLNLNNSYSQTGSGIPSPTLFSNTGSTEAQIWNTNNTCEDIWIQVPIGPSGGFRANFTQNSGSSDLAVAAYSGTCSGQSPISFQQLGADDGSAMPVISVSCQPVGSTVYLRIWDYGCNNTSNFNVTLNDIQGGVPIGDEPVTAIPLTVDNPYIAATITNSFTETKGTPFPSGCSNGTADFTYTNGCEDIWFTVTIPSANVVTFEIDFPGGGSTDLNMGVYDSNCPGTLGLLVCDDNGGNGNSPKIEYSANQGEQFYVRVWDANCDFSSPVSFDIKVYTTIDSIDLPSCVTRSLPFNIATQVTLDQAIHSNSALTYPSIPDPSGCSNFVSNSWTSAPPVNREDVWFQFTVPASGAFQVSATSTGGAGDVELAVYETANGACGLPTQLIACDGDALAGNNATVTVSCRTPGEVMYLRIWEKFTDLDMAPSIFITEMLTSGDEVINPETISPGQSLPVDLSTLSHSWGPTPGCGNYQAWDGCEDHWFKTTVDASGGFIAEIENASQNISLAVYSGTCYINLVELGCDDGSAAASVQISGRTPGEVLYLRTWDEQCNEFGTYHVKIQDDEVLVDPIVFLEGPYNPTTDLMNLDLKSNNLIPLQEPYTALGHHTGNETMSTVVLNGNPIVDWVLVELRDANDNTQIIATRAGLLMRDGRVTDTDGSSAVRFAVSSDSYQVAVRHRNHLGVMANTIYQLSSTATTVNFNLVGLYGTEATNTIGGRRVLWKGDANSDAIINSADRSQAWNERNLFQYLGSDVQLNGVCDASDRSAIWNRRNRVAQLP